MKSVVIAASLLLGSSMMYADLIPGLVSIAPITSGAFTGDFDWTYQVSMGANQEVDPAVGLAAGATQPWPNFFTILDFGSPTATPISTPANWGGSADTNAPNAFNTTAPNQANISDIQINYTGDTVVMGPDVICCFSFVSTTDQEALGWYEGQGTNSSTGTLSNGTEQGNVGRVVVPFSSSGTLQQIPEPATFVLLGSSLIGIGFLRRRKA